MLWVAASLNFSICGISFLEEQKYDVDSVKRVIFLSRGQYIFKKKLKCVTDVNHDVLYAQSAVRAVGACRDCAYVLRHNIVTFICENATRVHEYVTHLSGGRGTDGSYGR